MNDLQIREAAFARGMRAGAARGDALACFASWIEEVVDASTLLVQVSRTALWRSFWYGYLHAYLSPSGGRDVKVTSVVPPDWMFADF